MSETSASKDRLRASIVVPALDTELYIQPCIESLLGQTRQAFEIIVVDDCSTGDIKSVVDRIQCSGPEIKYVRHPRNHGALGARFTGVDHSSGDYIGFLDSDDIAHPNYVARLLDTAAETGADIIGSTKETNTKAHFAIEGTEEILKAYASRQIPNWSVWTKLYKRDLVAGLNTLRCLADTEKFIRANDLVFNIFCALQGPKYVNIPDTLVRYTKGRAGSITNPISSELRREGFKSLIRTYEIIRDAAPGYEDYIDQIISQSAKNNYRYALASSEKEDLDGVRAYSSESPVGHLVMSAMLEAADENRRRLADRLGKFDNTLSNLKARRDVLREKLALQKQKLTDARHALVEERKRRQRLGAILTDLLRWGRSLIPR